MTKISGFGYDEQALRLCIDGMRDGRVWGRIVSMRLSEPLPFHDLSDFAVKLDAVMDEQNFPQSFQRKRGFKGGNAHTRHVRQAVEGDAMTREQIEAENGAAATITVRILTRQNASWQGHALLPDSRAADFKSELELFNIISDYLDSLQ